MKKRMQRAISFLLTIVMVVGMVMPVNFASQNDPASAFKGKTVSVLGDSISTYTGVSNNTGYNSTIGSNAIFYSTGRYGVYQHDTWWQQAIDALGMELCVNNSWSGSRISQDGSGPAAYKDRCVQLHNNEGEEPDYIWVYLGTNDHTSSSLSWGLSEAIDTDTLFAKNGENYDYPAPTTVCEAYAIMLHKAMQRYPDAQIYCLGMLTRNAISETLTAHNKELEEVAALLGIPFIELESITVKPEDYSLSMGDTLHPKAEGMDRISQRVINAMLGNEDHKELDVYDITYSLTDVTSSSEAMLAFESGTYETQLSVAEGYQINVKVTMGGVDVTEECYQDGKISLSNVNGAITITAKASNIPVEYEGSVYRWELNDSKTALVNVDGDGYASNAVTLTSGTISGGSHAKTIHSLNKPVVLAANKSWSIEWKASGNGEYMLLSSATATTTAGVQYLYVRSGGNFIGFGEYTGSRYMNYGQADLGNLSATHVYRIDNRVSAGGSNMPYLIIDGVEVGPLTTENNHGTNQLTTSDWLNGQDLQFSYLGSSSHAVNGITLEYLQITEEPEDEHIHSYQLTDSKANSCKEAGYEVYACSCGQSYTRELPTLNHAFGPAIAKNGVLHYECQDCGAEVTKEMVNYRWELNAGKSDLVSVETDYNTKNELTRDTQGTVSNGTFSGVSYALATPVTLLPTDKWVIEWKASSGSQWMLLWNSTGSGMAAPYLFHYPNGNNDAWFLGYSDGNYKNYGVDGLDTNTLHTYRIANKVYADGSNMPYLYVDGAEVGPMNEYYNVVTPTNTTVDWLNGQTLTFDHLGKKSGGNHTLNAYVEYVQIYAKGADEHDHDFSAWVANGNGALTRGCSICGKVETKEMVNYRWELNEDKNALVSVTGGGFTENALETVAAGTVSDGTFSGTYYKMDTEITLKPTDEWVIEWRSKSGNEWMLFANANGSGAAYPYVYNNSGLGATFIGCNNGGWKNYGVTGQDAGNMHTYRIINQINADGTNMPHLYVDGVDKGAMNMLYHGTSNQERTDDFLSGKELVFTNVGSSTHPLRAYLEYVEVYTVGRDTHEHDYSAWKDNGDGTMSRVCGTCQKTQTEAIENYRWELNEAKDALVSVTDGGFMENALTVSVAGTVSNGTFSGTILKMNDAVTLEPDKEWVIEWRGSNTERTKLLADGQTSRTKDRPYLFYIPGAGWFFGYHSGSTFENFGVDGLAGGVHTYRIVNKVNADGSNMPYLYVDGVEAGPMNEHYEALSNTNTTEDWLNGQTLVFDHLGRNDHKLSMTLEYLEIWVNGENDHEHAYSEWSVVGGQMVRACECGQQDVKNLQNYCWELNETKDALVNVTTNGFIENAVTKVSGTISNGVHTGTIHSLAEAITLSPTEEWTIEWKSTGDDTSHNMLLSGNVTPTTENNQYIYHRGTGHFLGFGQMTTGYINYGVTDFKLDFTQPHVFRIENRVAADGSNMAYLVIDDVEIGAMNTVNNNGSNTATTDNWVNGKTLTFQYLGATGFAWDRVNLEYLQINLTGGVHQHAYKVTDSKVSTCKEAGFKTYTCSCGLTYTKTEEKLPHDYTSWNQTNGVLSRECTKCGTKESKQTLNYRWELNEAKDALVSVTTNGFKENTLSTAVAGTVSNGTFSGSVFRMSDAVTLLPTDEWVIEWRGSNTERTKLLADGQSSGTKDRPYLFYIPDAGWFFGYHSGSVYENFGVDGLSASEIHTYRIVNKVNADGSNMPYLYVDGVEVGPMNEHYEALSNKKTTEDWLNGQTLVFDHLGRNSHKLSMTLEYLEIYTRGMVDHHHVFSDWAEVNGKLQRECECGEVETKDMLNYRWEYSAEAGDLISVTTGGNTENVIARINGSNTDGMLSGAVYALNNTVTLNPTDEWVLEWKSTGADETMIVASTAAPGTVGAQYLYYRNGGAFLGFGTRTESQYLNYGVHNLQKFVDLSKTHVFRIENRVAEDGSNMAYLLIDGTEIGAMNQYNLGGNNQNKTDNWLNGTTLSINNLGATSSFYLDLNLEYVQIWAKGYGEHQHVFGPWSQKTTGDLERACKNCGEVETQEVNVYRWELNEAGTGLVNVTTGGIDANVLTTAVAGTVSNGTFNGSSYKLAKALTLEPQNDWAIEWRAVSGSEWMLLYNESGSPYMYYNPTHKAWFLGENNGGYKNYGVDGLDGANLHTYSLVNQVNEDGSNMVYLYVDGVKVGPMNEYYMATSSQNTTVDWLNGRTLTFTHLGRNNTSSHALNAAIEYAQVWEKGYSAHVHTYGEGVETLGNCSNEGYFTYTCTDCGYAYTKTNGKLGEHVYGEWYVYENKQRHDCQFCDQSEVKDLYAVRWELNEDKNGLVSVSNETIAKNDVSKIRGSVTDGLMQSTTFKMKEALTLSHDVEWVIEWKAAGDLNEYMVLSGADGTSADGVQYLYSRPNGEFLGFGYRNEGSYFNYGAINLGDRTEEHVYRIENRVAEDGSNMPCLMIDDIEVGVLNNYFFGGTNENRTSDALNGMDLVFGYLGSSSHPMRGITMEYLQIWVNGLGEDEHKHAYKIISSTSGDCQTLIQNVYKCDCGDSYVGDTDQYGPHAYDDWAIVDGHRQHTCAICQNLERVKIGIEYDEAVSDNYYNVLSQKEYVLIDGVNEYEFVLNNDAGTRRQVLHVVEVDTFNTNVEILPSYYGIDKDLTDPKNWSAHIMEEQMDYYRDVLGYNVVAGMNTALNYSKDAPCSFLVYNGVVLADRGTIYNDNPGSYLAVIKNDDGTVTCEVRGIGEGLKGNEWHAVGCNFGFILKDGKMVNQTGNRNGTADRSMIGVKADGTLVIVQAEGRNAPYATGLSDYELCETMLALGCQWAINGDGGGSSQILTKREGESDYVMRNIASDGTARATINGVIIASKAVADGIFDHASMVTEDLYITPTGSADVEVKGVDKSGAPAELPEGITYEATGGTFVDGVFTSDGTVGEQIVTAYLGDKEVGSVKIQVVVPDSIAFDNAAIAVPYGETIDIRITGYYGNIAVELTADDVDFDLSTVIGTIQGMQFTALNEAAAGENKSAVLTATLVYDTEQVQTITVTIGKGSEVIYDFEDQDLHGWFRSTAAEYNSIQVGGTTKLVDKENGHVRNGDYAMAVELDYSNSLEAGFMLGTLVAGESKIFENALSLGMWVYFPDEADALRMDVNIAKFDDAQGTNPAVGVSGAAYVTNGGEAEITEVGFVKAFDESGWHYLTIDLSSYPYTGLIAGHSSLKFYVSMKDGKNGYSYGDYSTVNGKYTLYVDDITVDYSEAIPDREAPEFGGMTFATAAGAPTELNGNTVFAHTLSFAASVAENTELSNYTGIDKTSARAYIDGVDVTKSLVWSDSGEEMMLEGVTLTSGMHTIKFSICDKAGNYNSVVRSIIVESAEAAKVKVVPHDPEADRILLGSLYYVDVVADDPQTISTVNVVMDLNNVSHWQLDHMEVADGFEVTYTLVEDENIATVTITGDGTTKLTGDDQILISIPIRTWELPAVEPIYSHDGIWMYDQYKAVNEILPMDLSIEIDGIQATYTTGSSVTYTGPIVQVDTEMSGNGYTSSGSAVKNYIGDEPWYEDWNGGHDHRPETKEFYLEDSTNHVDAIALPDKAASCTEDGYINRTYCEVCQSVVDWGETIPATGHSYGFDGGVLKCSHCGDRFTGVYTDGKTYEDGVLSNSGWSGESYLVAGEKLTGVQKVPSPENMAQEYYYDFGEDGVCKGRVKYTGLFRDGDAYRYAYLGVLSSGWQAVDSEWYYFSESTMANVSGEQTINGVTFTFEEDGRLTSGVWVVSSAGKRYWFGPGYYGADSFSKGEWWEIDGKWYYFKAGYAVTGVATVLELGVSGRHLWTDLGEDGAFTGEYLSGFFTDGEGALRYADGGVHRVGLHQIEGDYYFFAYDGTAARGEYYAWETHCDLPCDTYEFGADCKMLRGLVWKDDELYIYVNGKLSPGGLYKIDGDYYFAAGNGKCIANQTYYAWATYCDLPLGNYEFGADYKMLHGLVRKGEDLYIYVNGKPAAGGLYKIDGDYYFAGGSGKCVTNQTYYAWATYCDLPMGNYEFGADGKMVNPPKVIAINAVAAEQAQLTLKNAQAGTCIVAIYDASGSMLTCGMAEVAEKAGKVTVSYEAFTCEGDYTVKVFLVDGAFAALTEAVEQEY